VKPDSKAASAKVEALIETLEPLIEEGQKVLVFSQFVELLKILKAVEAAGTALAVPLQESFESQRPSPPNA